MTKLTLSNNTDLDMVSQGRMKPEDVRTIEMEASVDTSVTLLAIPTDVCLRLGLRPIRTAPEGTYMCSLRIVILGRDMGCDALATAGTTAVIGRIPLLALDLVLNPESGELRTNPAHPDGPLMYALRAA